MNIFVTNADPKICAAEHCDRHVIKMILETAQMLSTVIRLQDTIRLKHDPLYIGHNLYKATHANHPCIKWLQQSPHNVEWLGALGSALCSEYTRRYDKVHKSAAIIDLALWLYPDGGRWDKHTPFVPVMPPEIPAVIVGVHDAYKIYIAASKRYFATWKNGEPAWWQQSIKIAEAQFPHVRNSTNDGI